MDDVRTWFYSLPRFTRYWFGGTVALSILGRFGLLSPAWMILDYNFFIHKFQIWRPLTALFYYPITPQTGFHFLMNLYFLVNYSKMLESGVFASRPAEYATLMLFNWLTIVISALLMNSKVLMDMMVMSVLYIWCSLYKDVTVTFWFGTQFKARYLPWVLFGFKFLLGGGGTDELIGILVGHLYIFLKFQYSEQYGGPSLLSTPAILESYFPPVTGGMGGFGVPPATGPRAPAAGSGDGEARGGGGGGPFGGSYRWGRGQTLGN